MIAVSLGATTASRGSDRLTLMRKLIESPDEPSCALPTPLAAAVLDGISDLGHVPIDVSQGFDHGMQIDVHLSLGRHIRVPMMWMPKEPAAVRAYVAKRRVQP